MFLKNFFIGGVWKLLTILFNVSNNTVLGRIRNKSFICPNLDLAKMVGTGAGSATLLLTILSSPQLIWAEPWEMPVGGTALLTRRTWAETRQAVPGLPQASFLIFKSTHKPIQKYQAYPRPLSSFISTHRHIQAFFLIVNNTHRPIQQYQAYPGLFPHFQQCT